MPRSRPSSARRRLLRMVSSVAVVIAAAACGGRGEPRAVRPLAACPPIPTDGLRLWLRADAGLDTEGPRDVRTWFDQSPEHNDVSQTAKEKRPVWEVSLGRTVVRFLDPEASLATSTLTGSMNELTVAVVLAPHDVDGNSEYLSAGGWSQFVFARGPGGKVSAGTSPAARIETPEIMKKYERQRYVFVNRDGNAALFLNGRQIAAHASAAPAPWSGFRLGGTDKSNGLRGDVAEVLVYRRVLSPAELGQVDAYLRAKYWDLPGCVCPDGRGPHPERKPAGVK